MEKVLLFFSVSAALLIVVFTVTWAIQLATRNAAIVDTVWSASFPLLAILYFFLSDGYLPRKILVTTMVTLWGLRLAWYLLSRTIGHAEDSRYTALREKWEQGKISSCSGSFIFRQSLRCTISSFCIDHGQS